MQDGAFVRCGRAAVAGVAAVAILALVPGAAAGQSEHRTSWGDPDIQGVWDFRTLTPLERPAELGDREFLTAEEAAEFEARQLAERDADRRDGAELPFGIGSDVERAYNQFWWDYGTNVNEDRRTSLITDPANGRIPYTEAGQAEAGRFFAVLFGNVAAGPEDRALGERCILGFNAGPPMLPSAYNNNVQLFQTPDTVVILNEMVHNARIVPLDGRPHLPSDVRQWVGDSRGRWGGRHAGRRDHQLPGRNQLRGVDGQSAPGGALHAHGGRRARLRVHGRGCDDVDAAVDGGRADEAQRPPAVRVRLPRGQLRHDEPAVGARGWKRPKPPREPASRSAPSPGAPGVRADATRCIARFCGADFRGRGGPVRQSARPPLPRRGPPSGGPRLPRSSCGRCGALPRCSATSLSGRWPPRARMLRGRTRASLHGRANARMVFVAMTATYCRPLTS